MVIVDTTVWVDYLRGSKTPEADWLEAEMGRRRLGLTDLILCEVLQGVPDERAAVEVERDLRRFALFPTVGIERAVAAASRYRALRRQGRTVRTTIDCLIASFCVENGHSLLHHDRDFDHFEQALGLAVIHP